MKKLSLILISFLLINVGLSVASQTDNSEDRASELTEEDLEIIQNLELIEYLDFLEAQDFELLENLDVIQNLSENIDNQEAGVNDYDENKV